MLNRKLMTSNAATILIAFAFTNLFNTSPHAMAFSPYELFVLSGKDTRVGLITRVKQDREAEVKKTLLELERGGDRELLDAAGIRNIACFSRRINSATWIFLYFEYAGGKEYISAARAFNTASPKLAALSECVSPAGSEAGASGWTQMEWISYIRGKNIVHEPAQKIALVTTLRREKELEYRTMHQAIWPGVVDQMARGNNRNFSAFLCEIDQELYEFIYVEYVGADAAKDNEQNQRDPINRRWWKHTDACQKPLPGEKALLVNLQPISADN
jgi:L-rhamnose mutarotase